MNPSSILAKILKKNATGDLLANMSKDLGEYAASAPVNKMYGTHSLNASKLAGADQLGGFAMPSVAVRNANAVNGSKLSEFGDVVMIPKGDTFLPSRNTKVFSTDAYTPMMPRTLAEADPAMWSNLTGKYPGLNKFSKNSFDVNYDLTANPADNASTLYEMLKYGDIDPGADDFYKFREMLRDGNVSDDVRNFVDDVAGVSGPKMFMAGHTPSGNRRLKDYTLENAIKIMKADIKQNSGAVHGSVGSPSAMGVMEASNSKPITSLKEMRERSKWLNADPLDMEKYGDLIDNKDLMSLPHTGKYREMNKGMMSRLNQTANELYKAKTGKDWVMDSNPFTNYDTQMNVLGDLEWYLKNNPGGTASDIAEMTGPLNEFKNILNNQPVKYFESKPLRGVGFDEWEGAVLPEGDELAREILNKRGVPILGNYNSADENALEMLMAKLVSEGKIPLYATGGILGGGSILNALMGGGADQEYA